jgi:hypothetical protein
VLRCAREKRQTVHRPFTLLFYGLLLTGRAVSWHVPDGTENIRESNGKRPL